MDVKSWSMKQDLANRVAAAVAVAVVTAAAAAAVVVVVTAVEAADVINNDRELSTV